MPKAAQNFPDDHTLTLDAGVDLEVCQCSGCGLIQLTNEPVPYFREVIRAAAVSEIITEAKTRQFAEFIEAYSLQGRKVIEVGCGTGEFLSLLSAFNVDAYGVEYSEASVLACRQKGLRVFQGYPDGGTSLLAGGPFQAFLLLMFLEHMPDPNAALRTIWNSLLPGAVGIVEVPNFDMVINEHLFSEVIGDHLLYFTRESLYTTLQLNGFEVLQSTELRDEYVISVVVRKRGQLDISHFQSQQKKITTDLNRFLDRYGKQRVAAWGAGHQALATLALTGIAERLRYVVDSAPFKQGHYTPATHIPIVNPEVLTTDPVDAVIVMAASYSDEVAAVVRQRLSPTLAVGILRDFGLEMV